MSHFHQFVRTFKTSTAEYAAAKVLGRHVHIMPAGYTSDIRHIIVRLHTQTIGTPQWQQIFADLLAVRDQHKAVESTTNGGVNVSTFHNDKGHAYEIARSLDPRGRDPSEIVKDPMLMFHHVYNIPGSRGALTPNEPEAIIRLKNAEPSDYFKLLDSKEIIEAFERSRKRLEKHCKEGGKIEVGTHFVFTADMVSCKGHHMNEHSNIIEFETVRNHHTFHKGVSSHAYVVEKTATGQKDLKFVNVGSGKSHVPFGDALNGGVAVFMWATAPIFALASLEASRQGISVEEWLVRSNHVEAIRLARGLDYLGNKMAPINHHLVNYYQWKYENRVELANWAWEAHKQNTLLLDQYEVSREDIKSFEEGRRVMEDMLRGGDPEKLYTAEERPKRESHRRYAEPGLYHFSTNMRLGLIDFATGTAADQAQVVKDAMNRDTSGVLSSPEVKEALERLLSDSFSNHATGEKLIEFSQKYRERALQAIAELPLEVRVSPTDVTAKLETNLELRVMVESWLGEIKHTISSGIADALVKDMHIDMSTIAPSVVMNSVHDSFQGHIQEKFFIHDSLVPTWNAWAHHTHFTAPTTEDLMKEQLIVRLQEEATARTRYDQIIKEFVGKSEKEKEKLKEEVKERKEKVHDAERRKQEMRHDIEKVQEKKQDSAKWEEEYRRKQETSRKEHFSKKPRA
ncbi:hypothetical protein SAMD00023353_1601850 [Rosellinia necatrix]|uniref:Uncharacterized protein n=1 Tax=Rosellinia necatrix TaxID=77044 RepID=A0A1W2TI51_ROSNE|nr:hypothetical protein SAMD00023353_1601850 [Rosellinia necatrix]